MLPVPAMVLSENERENMIVATHLIFNEDKVVLENKYSQINFSRNKSFLFFIYLSLRNNINNAFLYFYKIFSSTTSILH